MRDTLYKLTDPISVSSIKEFREEYPEVGIGPNADLREFGYAWGGLLPKPGKNYEPGDLTLNGAYVEQSWNPVDHTFVTAALDKAKVSFEADKRLLQPVSFHEKEFQADDTSKARIRTVATVALSAIVAGAQREDYKWYDSETDFAWIALDNSQVAMDAHDFLAFSRAVAVRDSKLVLSARALKDLPSLPEDFTDDKYWN